MKTLMLLATVWLAISCRTAAFGERGAVERLAYYAAYLAEEVMYPEDEAKWTIAPGCKGASGRCSLQEFLLYIWKPGDAERAQPGFVDEHNPEHNRPTLGRKGLKQIYTVNTYNNAMKSFKDAVHQISSWSEPWPGDYKKFGSYDLTHNTDGPRTAKDTFNYYDALPESTKPLAALRAKMTDEEFVKKLPNKWKKDLVNQLLDNGQRAIDRGVELREIEFEHGQDAKGTDKSEGRIKGTQDRLKVLLEAKEDIIVVQKAQEDRTGLKGLRTVLDHEGTVEKLKAKYPNINEALELVYEDYLATRVRKPDGTMGQPRLDHARALESCKSAAANARWSCGK